MSQGLGEIYRMKYVILSALVVALAWSAAGCGDDKATQPGGGEAAPRFVRAWYASKAPGSRPAGVTRVPIGVAVAQNGDVYVMEASKDEILRYDDLGVYKEIVLKGVQSELEDLNNPVSPTYIALDSKDEIYVTKADSVKKFRIELTEDDRDSLVFLGGWGGSGSGPGQFWGARGIVADLQDNFYVFDAGNYRVQKFTSSGGFITAWGDSGSGDGQFGPSNLGFEGGIAVDSLGTVFVADTGNGRIQKFTADGTFVGKFGSKSSLPPGSVEHPPNGQFKGIAGIAAGEGGTVYVVDHPIQPSVQKFTGDGVFLSRWGSWCPEVSGGSSACDGNFAGPAGIVVREGNVFVTEMFNKRVQKFTYNEEEEP
jgi:hypothetical protein